MSASAEWNRIREANRVRQTRELQERGSAQRELEANATPETIKHRKACVVDELLARGKLTAEQRRAGAEIALLWVQITAGLFARVQKYDLAPAGKFDSDWRAGTITAYQERYIPWRDEAGRQPLKGRTVADLVFLLVVDNYGVRQIGDSWGMDQRRVLAVARESLYRYAEIAGWVDSFAKLQNSA